jgi:hypothetical protein
VVLRSVLQLLVTANVVPSLPILVILLMRRYVPPKSRFLQEPRDVTSQKTVFFKTLVPVHQFGADVRETRRPVFPKGTVASGVWQLLAACLSLTPDRLA